MVEGALNAAAELVLEATAYGNLLERDGNRSPHVAPQGLYRGRGDEHVARDLGRDRRAVARAGRRRSARPAWATDPELATYAGDGAPATTSSTSASRRGRATSDADEAAELLVAHGVPAAVGARPALDVRPPAAAGARLLRGDRPPGGRGGRRTPTLPFRFASVDRWLRTPAPTLGQHNHEILVDDLGVDEATLRRARGRRRSSAPPQGPLTVARPVLALPGCAELTTATPRGTPEGAGQATTPFILRSMIVSQSRPSSRMRISSPCSLNVGRRGGWATRASSNCTGVGTSLYSNAAGRLRLLQVAVGERPAGPRRSRSCSAPAPTGPHARGSAPATRRACRDPSSLRSRSPARRGCSACRCSRVSKRGSVMSSVAPEARRRTRASSGSPAASTAR